MDGMDGRGGKKKEENEFTEVLGTKTADPR